MVPTISNDTNWMGLVTMSERDLKRIEVLTEVLAGRRTVVSAAAVLALGVRQTFRLLARYQEGVFIFELRRKQIAGVCLQNRPDLVNNVPRLTFSCVVKVSQCIDISALLCLCCLLDIPLRHEGVAVSDPRKM